MQKFNLKIITPEKIFFQGEAVQLIAKTISGNIGILAGHTPYVSNLVPSPLIVYTETGKSRKAAVANGILKVTGEDVIVVTTAVEWADEIDIARAERAKQNAELELKAKKSDKEFERAEQHLRRALNRLIVSGKK